MRQSRYKRISDDRRQLLHTYNVWKHMIERCNKDPFFISQGIYVCNDWESFGLFLHDIGMKPKGNYALKRKDVHGPYEKSNCEWKVQSLQKVRLKHGNRKKSECRS